jgi:hypothetical protein
MSAGFAVHRGDIYHRVCRGEDPVRVGHIYWLTDKQVQEIHAEEAEVRRKRAIAEKRREAAAYARRCRQYPWWKLSEFLHA